MIFELWERGATVDQIASATGIPRSTVGYYVRKFSRLAAGGRPIVIPEKPVVRPESETIISASAKGLRRGAGLTLRANAQSLIGQKKFQELYYLLMAVKLARELKPLGFQDLFEEFVGTFIYS